MKQQQKAPLAMFERYYAKDYSMKREWAPDRKGHTRKGLFPLGGDETEKIGSAWDKEESEVAKDYYRDAENNLPIFWSEDSVFYEHFKQLDSSYIVELACGHGRHVSQYLPSAKEVILVDINQSNIDFCKSRFASEDNIQYLVTSGCDFAGIESNSQTAVFTYDAMVHFELLDVLGYLKDANRILKMGGKILFHHSNIDFYPELSGTQKPLWRNFMSADIFVYLATRLGFQVISQHVLSFGRGKNFYPNTDCLSLCEKIRPI